MKRFITVLFALVFAFTLCTFSASAEGESFDLISEDLSWGSTPNGGTTCTITWEDGNAVISGSTSGTWPQIYTRYENDGIIKVNVSDYSLVYDFTVESGYTNFSFYFNTYPYTMANTAFYEDQSGRVDYNAGSGDIGPGVYKGSITLTELTESSTLYGNEAFSQYAVRNGILEFHGMEFFSVDGGIITVRELKLVPTAEVTDEPTDDPVVSDEPSEDPVVSDDVVSEGDDGNTAVSEPETDTDTDTDATASTDATEDTAEEDNNLIIWIIVGVVGLAVIATVVVVVLKKKK